MGVSAGCAHKAEAIRDSKIPHNQKAYQLLLSETYKTNKLSLGVVVTTCYLHSTQSRITENIQDIARAQLRIDSVSHKGHRWWQYKAIAAIFFLLSDSIYVLFPILYRSYTANQIAYDGADFLRSVLFREGTGSNPILLQVGHRSPRPAVAHHPCFFFGFESPFAASRTWVPEARSCTSSLLFIRVRIPFCCKSDIGPRGPQLHIILAFYTRAVLVQPKSRLDQVRQLAPVKQVGLPRHARPWPIPSLA